MASPKKEDERRDKKVRVVGCKRQTFTRAVRALWRRE
jgi:hypothetical protein